MSSDDRSVNELHATDRLPEYVRGRLEGEERAEVEAHVAACAACREEVGLLRALQATADVRLEPDEVDRLYTPLAPSQRARRAGVWRAAAGLAIVLAGYAAWAASRTDTDGESEDTWSADEALAGWEMDLAELRPDRGDLRAALGAVGVSAWPELESEELNGLDGSDRPWEDLEL